MLHASSMKRLTSSSLFCELSLSYFTRSVLLFQRPFLAGSRDSCLSKVGSCEVPCKDASSRVGAGAVWTWGGDPWVALGGGTLSLARATQGSPPPRDAGSLPKMATPCGI